MHADLLLALQAKVIVPQVVLYGPLQPLMALLLLPNYHQSQANKKVGLYGIPLNDEIEAQRICSPLQSHDLRLFCFVFLCVESRRRRAAAAAAGA